MMAAINILVTFGSENRVMTIPQGQKKDVITKIHTFFNIPKEYDIKLKRYSSEWQEWLNIDPLEIQDRDKIRVETCMQLLDLSLASNSTFGNTDASTVVTGSSTIEDTDASTSGFLNMEGCDDPFENISDQGNDEHRKVDILEQGRAEPLTDGQPGQSKKVADRKSVQLKPWPLNIHIPVENMSPQLRASLQQGMFPSDKLRKQLIQVIFDYMWQFGSHPSRYHYEMVAQQLVKDFPCLAQTGVPSAKPYDYWKMRISDKFRNERKSLSSLSKDDRKVKKAKRELDRTTGQQPSAGEDEESIKAHIKWMQDEYVKKSPEWQRVKKLMEITFEERRKDVTKKLLVPQLREKYPFLFTATELHNEFQRITGVSAVENISKNLKPFIGQILGFSFSSDQQQAENFRDTVKMKVAESVTMESAEEIKTMAALYLLPSVLKKKPSAMMGPQNKDTVSPYLVIDPSIFEANKSLTVCTENEAIANTNTLLEGIALLIETYYVFDMQYQKDAKDVFNFIECCLLKMKAVKPSRCVSTALIKLQTTLTDAF